MTNTKFRKRALLSSVAMLLVALVALGSATFAWFVQNPEANAEGFKMKTSTSASLVVQSETNALRTTGTANKFDHTTYLNSKDDGSGSQDAISLTPASYTGSAWAQVEAVDEDTVAGTGKTMGPASAGLTGPVYAEKIYFKLSTAGDAQNVYLKSVTWNVGQGDMAPGVHVMIKNSSGNVVAHFGTEAAQQSYLTGVSGTYATSTRAAYTNDRATQISGKGTITPRLVAGEARYNAKTKVDVTSGEVTESDLDYCTVYVYLDGEHDKVYSNNVVGDNLSDLLTALDIKFDLRAE